MGQQQSKDELLYDKAIEGNIEAVKALRTEGASLEWIDKDGKTPLIVACMNAEQYILAKTLIELGANVNAYRPGLHAGTPLHHAAKRGLNHTVRLLLSNGANPLVRNDDCQTPLDVARARGFTNVVRAIESHICFFSGWLKEIYGPSFLEAFAPQFLSKKIWVVIIPCGPHNPAKPLKLELAVYSTLQDAQPRAVVALWKTDIEEAKFHQSDSTLIIFDKSNKTRYKFASASDGDREQIVSLYNACRGIPQAVPPPVQHDSQAPAPTIAGQAATDAVELAMAINASIQFAVEDGIPLRPNNHPSSQANSGNGWGNTVDNINQNGWVSVGISPPPEGSSSGWINEPTREEHNGRGVTESRPTNNPIQPIHTSQNIPPPVQTTNAIPVLVSPAPSASGSGWMDNPTKEEYSGWGVPIEATHTPPNIPPVQTTDAIPVLVSSAPSAPPVDVYDEGPVHYPSIDLSPVDLCIPCVEHKAPTATSEAKDEDGSSYCVICWEAPVEGACVPCGHMAGCMSCLNEIKAKKGNCPVCRTKINQVVRLYAV